MAARRGRNPAGRYKISQGTDGKWHCFPRVGTLPSGKPKRVHIQRDTAEEVKEALEELAARQKAAGGAAPKKIVTVGHWLEHYLEHIVRPSRPQTTWLGYRSLFRVWAIPILGERRLAGTKNLLQPEHLDDLYNAMRKRGGRSGKGMKPTSIVKMHNVLSRAFDVAVRRGHAVRNVCDLVDKPDARKSRPDPYSLKEGQALLAAAAEDRLCARWELGLLLGPRQGEALGLRWSHMDLTAEKPRIDLQKQTQRGTWQHGCADPAACAAQRCKTKPCGPSWSHGCDAPDWCRSNPRFCPQRRRGPCRRHTRACPAPCSAGCVRHAAQCPDRVGGGLQEVDLKSEGSVASLYPPARIVESLIQRRAAQQAEFQALELRWTPEVHCFTTEDGKQVDPRRDYDAWHELGRRAGVPRKRLHAARHTAATLLRATGADIATVQEVLRHADPRTSRIYTAPAAEIQAQALAQLAEVMFGQQAAALLSQFSLTQKARE